MLRYTLARLPIVLCLLYLVISFVADRRHLQEVEIDFAALEDGKNAAVFAAYSADGRVPDYVISYLQALKEIAPNIIYITDNPLQKSEIQKLAPYVSHLEARRHGEYDWGSYKRGFALLTKKGWQKSNALLFFANDSVLLTTPSLVPVIEKMPVIRTDKNKEPPQAKSSSPPALNDTPQTTADFWGITANQDGAYHLQSYFLLFSPQVYQHPAFAAYLNNVKSEKDGLTVAAKYEVPLTGYLEDLGFKSAAYIPYETLSALPLNDKNCYPLTMLSRYHAPFLKMRTFTERLDVQEPRRLVFNWLKTNAPQSYKELIKHLQNINSPYLKDNR